jgi:thiol:disulfide interchange protein DsbD
MKKITLLFLLTTLLVASIDFLMPDEAFKPTVSLNDKGQVLAKINLGKDIYVYKEKVDFEIVSKNGISLSSLTYPKAVKHHDDLVYTDSPTIIMNLKKSSSVNGVEDVTFKISYQGCSEQGLCYEPLSKEFTLSVDSSKIGKKELGSLVIQEKKKELSESDTIAQTLESGNLFVVLATFFGFGLLLALTPCVFPMIPIISGLIISQGKNITTKKAFALSVVYVLAMAVAYTIAGVLAGLFGSNIQAALQAPWVIYSFSALFVALAMSMFGYYELKLPDALVSKVSSVGSGSGYMGVAIMGFLSALIVGPCVAAPLAGALVYIGQSGDALLGGMALFSMSIGMGLPLIVVGVSAGKFMPKPGAWMNMVSAIFGVIMLGVAIWMLERVVDFYIVMLLSAILGIGFTIYLGIFKKEIHLIQKSIAVVLFIYSIALFLGALSGSESMVKPLASFHVQTLQDKVEISTHEKFIKVTSLSELKSVLEENKGKRVMLDFYADWCVACKELESVTFSNSKVQESMKEFVLVQADVTLNGDDEKDLSKKYGVFGPPAILFFDKESHLLKSKTVIGFIEADKFLKHLKNIVE